MAENYEFNFSYPKQVILDNGSVVTISQSDVEKGVLTGICHESADNVRQMFLDYGYENVILENEKKDQIGSGLSREIGVWENHVRLLQLDKDVTGLASEIEISRCYVNHLNGPVAGDIYQMMNVFQANNRKMQIYHSKLRAFVSGIRSDAKYKLTKSGSLVRVRNLVLGILLAALFFGGAAAAASRRK